jgi:hypothetical protein
MIKVCKGCGCDFNAYGRQEFHSEGCKIKYHTSRKKHKQEKNWLNDLAPEYREDWCYLRDGSDIAAKLLKELYLRHGVKPFKVALNAAIAALEGKNTKKDTPERIAAEDAAAAKE